jgi:UDP-glucose 4-epimerase
MNKVLVTGGAGFIGSNLVDRLVEMGMQVTIIDNLSTGKKENINPAAYHWEKDLMDISIEQLAMSLESFGIDTIFHLAAKTSVQESMLEPELYNEMNVNVTLKLLEASRLLGIKKFIFSSSSSVYGDAEIPTTEKHSTELLSPYAATKLIGEEYCKLYGRIYGLDISILRYFNAYGNRMNNEGGYKSVLPIFKELKEKGLKLTINNDGNQRRDFVHTDDICIMNIFAAMQNQGVNTYNVGTGISYSVNEIADMFGGDRVYTNSVIEPFESLADITKAYDELKFKPKDKLKEWIKNYVN